jgi:hypothetical protein
VQANRSEIKKESAQVCCMQLRDFVVLVITEESGFQVVENVIEMGSDEFTWATVIVCSGNRGVV